MSATVRTLVRARSEADKVPVILDAAAACFTERGYDATTIDEIAARCGSTKGLIYYHFKSKTDLFFAVYHLAMSRPIERARTILQQEGSGAERLARMGQAHLLGMMEHLTYHHVSRQGVELRLASALTPEQQRTLRGLIQLRDEYEALYVSALRAGLEDGTLHCGRPERHLGLVPEAGERDGRDAREACGGDPRHCHERLPPPRGLRAACR